MKLNRVEVECGMEWVDDSSVSACSVACAVSVQPECICRAGFFFLPGCRK